MQVGCVMGDLQPTLAEAVAAAELVQQQRRQDPGLAISRGEAEALLALDRMQPDAPESWRDFIANAVADHIVSVEPAGILTEEKADWLLRTVAPNARVETVAAFETLMRAIETARETSASLAVFALVEVRAAIINGDGQTIGLRPHFTRVIAAEHTALLYRILIAAGGAEGKPVTRAEADALFDLHDATACSDNDLAFNELFFRSIANHVLAASGHGQEPRQVALAPDFILKADLRPNAEQTAWISERIMRDGRPTLAEFELLMLIGAEAKPDASLRSLLDSAA